MEQHQWSVVRRDPDLHLDALHAHFTTHAFARHWHDYYVVGLIAEGVQTFWYRRDTYFTTPGGLFLLNPGEPHTGQSAIEAGFTYRALYPTAEHMAQVMRELGRPNALPQFPTVRIDTNDMAALVNGVHTSLTTETTPLERQTRWLTLLTTLVMRYGADQVALPAAGAEPRAVTLARSYLEDNYAERITLSQLADQTSLSPYHLVRVFQRATGIPPHAYLESVRIRRAQQLIERGASLASVAYATGFSSQSHLTASFRRIIGVAPGHYREGLSRARDFGDR